METRILTAPSAELDLVDLGASRRIFLKGTAIARGIPQTLNDGLETPYTEDTIKKCIALKGDWWLDEMLRRQDPTYVKDRLGSLVGRFGSFEKKRVLDIGSGSGSSALVMLDLGAAYVTGVEIIPGFVDLARMRAADERVSDRVTFQHVTDTTHLPFADRSFDIITFNAVLEHLPPALRSPILKEAWRCLAPGGLLVFTETPNRAFPYDGHTTRLPFIPWLPLSLAYPFAKACSRNVPRGADLETYVSEGLVAGTYWQITRALPDAICLNAEGGDAAWKTGRKRSYPLVAGTLSVLEWVLNRFGLPFGAFMPVLDLVFKKP